MKRSSEIRLVVGGASVAMLAFVLFGVLFVEERKRVSAHEKQLADLLTQLQSSDQVRQRYYDGLATERESLRKQMADSKAQYDDLVAKQAGLVKAGRQQVTKVVNETVPVRVPVTTRATKSS